MAAVCLLGIYGMGGGLYIFDFTAVWLWWMRIRNKNQGIWARRLRESIWWKGRCQEDCTFSTRISFFNYFPLILLECVGFVGRLFSSFRWSLLRKASMTRTRTGFSFDPGQPSLNKTGGCFFISVCSLTRRLFLLMDFSCVLRGSFLMEWMTLGSSLRLVLISSELSLMAVFAPSFCWVLQRATFSCCLFLQSSDQERFTLVSLSCSDCANLESLRCPPLPQGTNSYWSSSRYSIGKISQLAELLLTTTPNSPLIQQNIPFRSTQPRKLLPKIGLPLAVPHRIREETERFLDLV